ncbi:hypothetical protein ASZ78_014014 [Callipepla squamata]|uniref:Uncharacterized protein n=1 Tax=Callipepla squamata TaxID=9009 RepID=A0A226NG88_CALSU|nr:hypothetical protein ASZ78_014014 [Callipepla squamata]
MEDKTPKDKKDPPVITTDISLLNVSGEEKDYFIFVILLLIALGTILVTVLHYFLCKRYCNLKRIFPPIPQPRDKFDMPAEEDIQVCSSVG